MGILKNLNKNHNHKKCVKAYDRIVSASRYSSDHSAILYISTDKGYEELFQMLISTGYDYTLSGNNREGMYITARKMKNFQGAE